MADGLAFDGHAVMQTSISRNNLLTSLVGAGSTVGTRNIAWYGKEQSACKSSTGKRRAAGTKWACISHHAFHICCSLPGALLLQRALWPRRLLQPDGMQPQQTTAAA